MKPFLSAKPHCGGISLAPRKGFALIVTLSLMILLTVIAVGLLSLATISLRSSSQGEAMATARANARLGLMLAIGELQKTAGDDRRVMADGSILQSDPASNVKHPHAVGVWKSWSPGLRNGPDGGSTSYSAPKTDQFLGWLVSSSNPAELAKKDWAVMGNLVNEKSLFTNTSDGFILRASRVEFRGKDLSSAGTTAWAVVQDATRAKINIGGPEESLAVANDGLQAQPRPSLAQSKNYKQPTADWNRRAGRVISIAQAKLDADLWRGPGGKPEGADFTARGMGLLTDVVNGGLKTDLSLGFEMSESDFRKDSWGDLKNPFRAESTTLAAAIKTSYQGQRPLFAPLIAPGSVRVDIKYDPASTSIEFPAAAVPTFDTLRSFYRTPYHLYTTVDGPTVFERGMDHVAVKQASAANPAPWKTAPAVASQTSFRPVLDRVMYVLSAGFAPAGGTGNKEAHLVITPVVTLWNPYNIALEIEGAAVYPWMDLPFVSDWIYNGTDKRTSLGIGPLMAFQFPNAGRQLNPFFIAKITPSGTTQAGGGKSIRFKPGEVRVFTPVATSPTRFVKGTTAPSLVLNPVENPSQLSVRGGLALPMNFSRPMKPGDRVQVVMKANPWNNTDLPFFVGFEDATRAKLANPGNNDRGFAIGDVQTIQYSRSGVVQDLTSPQMDYNQLNNPGTWQPFGMIETYHRVASDAAANRRSDLVYTVNPRQPFINSYLSNGTFLAGPHYETTMRPASSFNQVMETASGGRTSFYGPSHSAATGESELAFFGVPQSPMLSLAALQHADLAQTCYSPANQFANSWASAYLARSKAGEKLAKKTGGGTQTYEATFERAEMPVYDFSYLANEAMWDSFYFSGASPSLEPGSATGSPAVWDSPIAKVTKDYKSILTGFIDDPQANPLRNPRMKLHAADDSPANLKSKLLTPEGCLKLAAHLMVDGAFNINSTSEKAWISVLTGMRDKDFIVRNGTKPSAGNTAFPRFRDPIGDPNNDWLGYRMLSDPEIESLAKNIVAEVRKRGPFLSLGEFVNRRIEESDLGLKGAMQAAIDNAGLNLSTLYDPFDTSGYPAASKANISPARAGVGIPGYLTQADVLQSIAAVISARSDTFTIRAYGEAKDKAGKVTASAWCEAVVQRMPEFVDPANAPHAPVAQVDANSTNKIFGRRFSMVSFRYLSSQEVKPDA